MSEFINYFNGLMLGDGSISKVSQKNISRYRYTQACIYKEWLDIISLNFNCNGFSVTISDVKPTINGFGRKNVTYLLQSKLLSFFEEQRSQWYKEWYNDSNDDSKFYYRKKVPDTIELTPECAANWYMGDGSITKYINSYTLQLSTESFRKKEVEYLVYILNEQVTDGFYFNKAGIRKSKEQSYKILLSKKQKVKAFLEYIKPYVASSFDYKIPEVN